MYLLKHLPEDFIVKEIPLRQPGPSGKYLYFRLRKKNRNTLEVVQEIARLLQVKDKQIGFAGSKDKKAVTEQVCSLVGVSKERLRALRIKDVEIEFLGYGNQPISLGDLQGNYFEIVVRDLDGGVKVKKISFFPNYFDEQRFGENNALLGKLLLKKEFQKVVETLNLLQFREHLTRHPHDFVGALLLLPIRQLRMYLNAYQSLLWNETLAEFLRRKGRGIVEIPYRKGTFVFVENGQEFKDLKIPIVGFGLETLDIDSEVQEIVSSVLASEAVSSADFIIKQIPALTLEGELRKALVEVKDLEIGKLESDEAFPGKYKAKLTFFLPKGSYATMAVRNIFVDSSRCRNSK